MNWRPRRRSDRPAASADERRLRRLLGLYPREFRQEYEDELLGVLLSEGRPGLGQVIDVACSSVAVRIGRLWRQCDAPSWRQAAQVVQVYGGLLLLALAIRHLVLSEPVSDGRWWAVGVAGVLAFAALVAGSVLRSRGPALLAASVGFTAVVAESFRYYSDTPAMLLNRYWMLLTAAIVLIAACCPGQRSGSWRRSAWPPGSTLVGLAGALLVSHGLGRRSGLLSLQGVIAPSSRSIDAVTIGLLVAAGFLTVLATLLLSPVVRRRVIAVAAPVVSSIPLVQSGFDGFVEHNARNPYDVWTLSPFQWVVLVLVPLALFAVIADFTRRWEQTRATAAEPAGPSPAVELVRPDDSMHGAQKLSDSRARCPETR